MLTLGQIHIPRILLDVPNHSFHRYIYIFSYPQIWHQYLCVVYEAHNFPALFRVFVPFVFLWTAPEFPKKNLCIFKMTTCKVIVLFRSEISVFQTLQQCPQCIERVFDGVMLWLLVQFERHKTSMVICLFPLYASLLESQLRSKIFLKKSNQILWRYCHLRTFLDLPADEFFRNHLFHPLLDSAVHGTSTESRVCAVANHGAH